MDAAEAEVPEVVCSPTEEYSSMVARLVQPMDSQDRRGDPRDQESMVRAERESRDIRHRLAVCPDAGM